MERSERRYKELMAFAVSEISEMTRYASRVVVLSGPCGRDSLLLETARVHGFPIAEKPADVLSMCADDDCPAVLIDYPFDGEERFYESLSEVTPKLPRGARIFVIGYSPSGEQLEGGRELRSRGARQSSALEDRLRRVADEAGLEVVRSRRLVFLSRGKGYLSALMNSVLCALPLMGRKACAEIAVLRPRVPIDYRPSLSIIVPARNERGTVEDLLRRLPSFGGARVEVIFVEGHSTDGTWEAIQSAMRSYDGPLIVRAFKQEGTGKGNAVRLGFEKAEGELLAILDADSTVPPEYLEDFYEGYRRGDGDFLNGNRLHFPMEQGAMRPLNKLGNIFFSRTVSFVADCDLGDTLCGTKLLRRADYERMRRWRHDFGDFDPFGDFELLFPAAVLSLGIKDVPVHYKARVYGETNIHRFRHGLQLLWMVLVGFWRIKLGIRSRRR
jgi:hypothetical protein